MSVRTRRRLLLSAILCVSILLLPLPGNEQRVGGVLMGAYRMLVGYPIVSVIVFFGAQAENKHDLGGAEQSYALALNVGQVVPGSYEPPMAYAYERFARFYQRQKRYADAVLNFRYAALVIDRTNGDKRQLAGIYDNLALSLQQTGATREAVIRAQAAVALREGFDDVQALANSLDILANEYLLLNQPSDAKPLLERAVTLLDEDPDTDDLDLAPVLNNLGIAQEDVGEFDQAERSFRRSLEIRQDELGPDDPDVAKVLNNLGSLAVRQKDYAKAQPLLDQAMAIYDRNLHPTNANQADTLLNLARIAQAQGRDADGEALLRRSRSIREQFGAAGH